MNTCMWNDDVNDDDDDDDDDDDEVLYERVHRWVICSCIHESWC